MYIGPQVCLYFCGHECVDELNENKLVLEENLKREVTSTRSRLLNLGVAAFVLIPVPLKISRQSQVMSVICRVLPLPIPPGYQRHVCPKPAAMVWQLIPARRFPSFHPTQVPQCK